jgi:hypothetical protein
LSDAGKDEAPEWGPAMGALPEKRRAFVIALYSDDAPMKGKGLLIWAAARAGYGTPTSSNQSLSVIAARLVSDDRIRAAIVEFSRSVVRAISPDAVRAVRDLIKNPKARDHARALAMVLDRTDPIETTHNVKIDDRRPPSIEVTDKVIARIAELARRAGAPGLPPPAPVIDADFQVVEGKSV